MAKISWILGCVILFSCDLDNNNGSNSTIAVNYDYSTTNDWQEFPRPIDSNQRIADAPFNRPTDVKIINQQIVVADRMYQQIIHLANMGGEGRYTQDLMPEAGWPTHLATDTLGRIYVTDHGCHCILRYEDRTSTLPLRFPPEGNTEFAFSGLEGITLDIAGRIYVADSVNHRIVIMDDMEGTNLVTIGTIGSGEGEFYYPTGIAVGVYGNILVADRGNDRLVQFFNFPEGTINNWQEVALSSPADVRLDSLGRIYVSSLGGAIFRLDGMQSSLDNRQTGPGEFINQVSQNTTQARNILNSPNLYGSRGFDVDQDFFVYIADSYNNRIVRLKFPE